MYFVRSRYRIPKPYAEDELLTEIFGSRRRREALNSYPSVQGGYLRHAQERESIERARRRDLARRTDWLRWRDDMLDEMATRARLEKRPPVDGASRHRQVEGDTEFSSAYADAHDWVSTARSPCVFTQKDEHGYFARVWGEGFLRLPNVEIKSPPCVRFRLHDLAREPHWELRVRQRVCPTYRGGVRVSIVNTHSKNSVLRIKLPRDGRDLLPTNLADVMQRLAEVGGELSSAHLPLYTQPAVLGAAVDFERELARRVAAGELDETEVVQMFNAARYERLKDHVSPPDDMPEPDLTNVASFVEEVERRRAQAEKDLPERVRVLIEELA